MSFKPVDISLKRFAIAFSSDEKGTLLKLIEASSENEALRTFFDHFVTGYSKDSEGFSWFKEDFYMQDTPLGALTEV